MLHWQESMVNRSRFIGIEILIGYLQDEIVGENTSKYPKLSRSQFFPIIRPQQFFLDFLDLFLSSPFYT